MCNTVRSGELMITIYTADDSVSPRHVLNEYDSADDEVDYVE